VEAPSPGNDPSRNDNPSSGAGASDIGGVIFAIIIVLCLLRLLSS